MAPEDCGANFSSQALSDWNLKVLHMPIRASGTRSGAYRAAGLAAANALLHFEQGVSEPPDSMISDTLVLTDSTKACFWCEFKFPLGTG